ncbi:unnamed protein product [Toxocara canis]|uniref:DBR1 domain-containing protein n=1 Tax=Toxocara canis TaxID=6265 RepID=A0A183UP06_TOXCA|nr:unnamed protein product [Toxocara canis]
MAHSHVSPLRGLTAKDIDSADDASQISLNSEEQSPNKRRRLSKKLHVAVAGCSHGEMDKIYASLAEIERIHGFKFDLLISCGDYQARQFLFPEIGRTAPVLTVFVGGNHEASGFLQELPNGGWVAPRIFYMGHANVVQFAGLRIAGLSGIFNKLHYDTGHWERPPFHECGGVVSAYHVRSVDVFRLKQLRPKSAGGKSTCLYQEYNNDSVAAQRVDIMVSHDWPAGITDYGDVEDLLKKKPFFKEDIEKNALGNPATMSLLHEIRPRYWLAAHLHCKFAALVPHQKDCQETTEPEPTRFLSLDKPLPRRHFIQALEFDVDEGAEMKLSYDPVWLAILKATDSLTDATKRTTYMPSQCGSICGERWDYRPTEEEINRVQRLFEGDFTIPANFRKTAPPHDPSQIAESEFYYRNPQSSEFCAKLGIRDLNEMLCAQSKESLGVPYFLSESEDDAKNMGESIKTSHSDTEKFDGDCDFVIDRGHRSCPIYLTDFNAPKLLDSGSKDENEDEGNNGSDESAEPVEAVVEGKEGERGRRKVGSGIFRRRPMGVVVDEESD